MKYRFKYQYKDESIVNTALVWADNDTQAVEIFASLIRRKNLSFVCVMVTGIEREVV